MRANSFSKPGHRKCNPGPRNVKFIAGILESRALNLLCRVPTTVLRKTMIPTRLPLSHWRRQQLRDERLWIRESRRAVELNVKSLHCPCNKCRGRKRLLIRNVGKHLLRHGRHPDSRIWRGSGERESSDDEWDEQFWGAPAEAPVLVDATVDTCGMLQ